jgi:hypothetical protein
MLARFRQKVTVGAVMPWRCVLTGHDWLPGPHHRRCGRLRCSFEAWSE